MTQIGNNELRMLDQFQMGPNLVRGFAPNGIGPRDINPYGTGDALGGTKYWGASYELQMPFWFLPKEVGLKGARTSAYGLDPNVAIATDVTIPGDHPGVTQNDAHVIAGKGPVIAILDAGGRGIIAPRPVLRWLRESADKASVPYQLGVGNGGTTDATAINITKSGIPCSVISVPARYIHSPVEVLSLRDLDQGAELIAAAIVRAHEYF